MAGKVGQAFMRKISKMKKAEEEKAQFVLQLPGKTLEQQDSGAGESVLGVTNFMGPGGVNDDNTKLINSKQA